MAETGRRSGNYDGEERNEWGMPKMREPDFSSVRKHIFAPGRIIVFIVISLVFWFLFYYFFPNRQAPKPEKQSPPAASEPRK